MVRDRGSHGRPAPLRSVVPRSGNDPMRNGAGEEARLPLGIRGSRDTVAAAVQRNSRHRNRGGCGPDAARSLLIGIAEACRNDGGKEWMTISTKSGLSTILTCARRSRSSNFQSATTAATTRLPARRYWWSPARRRVWKIEIDNRRRCSCAAAAARTTPQCSEMCPLAVTRHRNPAPATTPPPRKRRGAPSRSRPGPQVGSRGHPSSPRGSGTHGGLCRIAA